MSAILSPYFFLLVLLTASFSYVLPSFSRELALTPEKLGSQISPAERSALKKLSNWNPMERSIRFPEMEVCSPHGFSKKLRTFTESSHQERATWIQQTLEACSQHPSFLTTNRFITSLRSNQIELDFNEIPGVQQLSVTLPNLEKMRFFASLRSGRKPAILLVCGTGCNLLSGAAKSLFALLHAGTDSHIFLLASGSGSDSIRDNKRLQLGGADEGANVFQLLALLSSAPEFSGRISGWNLAGLSIGGHAVLYAGVYLSQNPWNAEWPKVRSIVGYCPVVDLKPTLLAVDQARIAGKMFRGLLSFILKAFGKDLAGDTQGILPPDFAKKGVRKGELTPLLERLLLSRFRDRSGEQKLFPYPFDQTRVHTIKDYWDLNDYRNQFQLNTLPTTIISSENDFIVNPIANQLSLQKHLQQAPPHPTLAVIDLKKGGHCGQAGSYSWELIAQTLAHLLRSQSTQPSASSVPKNLSMRLLLPQSTAMDFEGYRFDVSNERNVYLILLRSKNIALTQNYRCDDFRVGVRPRSCFDEVKINIDANIAPFVDEEFFRENLATNQTTRSLLARALNSRIGAFYETGEQIGLMKSHRTTDQIFLFPAGSSGGTISP